MKNFVVYALLALLFACGVVYQEQATAFAPYALVVASAGAALIKFADMPGTAFGGAFACDFELTPEKLREAILDALKTHTAGLSEKLGLVETEMKTYGKVSENTLGEIKALGAKGEEIEKKVSGELDKLSKLEARLQVAEQELVQGAKSKRGTGPDKTLGEQFTESQALKEFAARFKGNDPTAPLRKFRGRSEELQVKSFGEMFMKRDITSLAGSAGPGIWSQRQPEIVSEPYRPLSIRNLIPSIPVTSNLIEYVRTKTRTSSVDYVSEGATKPKSDLVYERKETPIRKIAHYIKASMEVLADFPRLQAAINFELLAMLGVFEEDQLLLGDGTGDTIEGLIPQATEYDTNLNRAGDTRLDVVRHAMLQVSESFYAPTGIVLSPRDWERIELTKDNFGQYIIANATATTGPRLWGLPVIPSFAMPHGQFMVGAFATAAEIYDRMAAAIYVSTENEDDFINNMVTILAEERLGLAVKRPLSFVWGDFDDAGLSTGA